MIKIICIIVLVLNLLMCYINVFKKKEKPRNNVHFYVARNKNGDIYLYLGKPIRCSYNFVNLYYVTLGGFAFKDFGLNPNDFKDLKWEDEPVEVFINMKD